MKEESKVEIRVAESGEVFAKYDGVVYIRRQRYTIYKVYQVDEFWVHVHDTRVNKPPAKTISTVLSHAYTVYLFAENPFKEEE